MRRIAVVAPLVLACLSVAAPVGATPQEQASSSLAAAKDDNPGKAKGQDKQKDKPTKDNPGKGSGSKGGNPPSHSNGNGRDEAPGQVRSAPSATGADEGDSNANPRSENENEKITYCHVPPGNPANGHPITTSVNAIDPGHLNHPDDVIPPYEYVKQGETVTFGGLNWGPDAQAYVDAGCTTQSATPGGDPTSTDAAVDEVASAELSDASVSTVSKDVDEGFVDAILPEAGGARLGLLVLAIALVGGGAVLLLRRRSTF